MSDLHPSVKSLLAFFENTHLPVELQRVAEPCAKLAFDLANELGTRLPAGQASTPELTVGLRKLLEAKDCFVRERLAQTKKAGGSDGDTTA